MMIEWIYGQAGPPAGVCAGRLRLWAQAFEAWLEGSSSSAVRILRIYAWRKFLEQLDKPPWEVTTADVDAWTEAGRQAGLSEKWLRDRLRYLTRFYDFCETAGFDPAYSAQQHPVREAKKPKVIRCKDLNYLSRAEADALLGAIREDHTLVGKRDYALFHLLLSNGRKVRLTSRLCWGDLEFGEGELFRNVVSRYCVPLVRWPGSRLPPQEMPAEAWEPALDYLICSGRLQAMQPEWRLFPPLLNGASTRNLEGRPQEWANTKAIVPQHLDAVLIKYARWAGLQEDKLAFGHLRNTAVLQMAASGLSIAEMCSRLGIVNKRNLGIHLNRLRAYPKDAFWSERGTQPHEPRGQGKFWAYHGKPPSLRHGVFARSLPEEWLEQLFEEMPGLRDLDFEDEPLLWQIGLAFLLSMKITEVSKDEKSLKKMLRYLDLLGIQASRMRRAVQLWYRLREQKREDKELERELAELAQKMRDD